MSRAGAVNQVVIAVCAVLAQAGAVAAEPDAWLNVGYKGFGESIAALAGSGAVDCGFVNLLGESRPKRAQRKRAIACVRDASSRGVPFKFGTLRVPIDSYVHEVYVRTAAGERWKIVYDIMIDGDAPQQWNATCKDISVDPKTLYLNGTECVEKSTGRLVTQ